MKILVYGSKGWIGKHLEVIYGKCFLEDITLVNNLGITQLIAVLSKISNI